MSLHIVLLEPEIPQNTGNIARTCAALGASLHLIRPLGFSLQDKYLKRAGLDYWDKLDVFLYDSIEDFFLEIDDESVFMFTTKAKTLYTEKNILIRHTCCLVKKQKVFPKNFWLNIMPMR